MDPTIGGLTDDDAAAALQRFGFNEPTEASFWDVCRVHIVPLVRNPLIILLAVLGALAYMSGDATTGQVIWAMMAMAVGLQIFQEFKGEQAASKLRQSLRTTCNVLRGDDGREVQECDARMVVPGDLVMLAAGDSVPADGVILYAAFLQINQSSLTGESAPSLKRPRETDGQLGTDGTTTVSIHSSDSDDDADGENRRLIASSPTPASVPLSPDLPWVALAGSVVIGGHGAMRVMHTGDHTMIGRMVTSLHEVRRVTQFDKDMAGFTWMMIRFMLILAPLVAAVQALRHGLSMEVLLYAVSVSVGLAPEMLPMILTACLVYGASVLSSRHGCIVKRVNAMQSLGTMDALCTDKTGTLTQDTLAVNRSLDGTGSDSSSHARVSLALAKLNSHFQTGSSNHVEHAVQGSPFVGFDALVPWFTASDEVPFDYETRFSAVTLHVSEPTADGPQAVPPLPAPLAMLGDTFKVYKGAVEEVAALCTDTGVFGDDGVLQLSPLSPVDALRILDMVGGRGERALAVALGLEDGHTALVGFVTFSDPPKPSAVHAITSMQRMGVSVRMLTGDTARVASHVAQQVGIHDPSHVLEGSALALMTPSALRTSVKNCFVFARLTPSHKQLIVKELQAMGHCVGFIGDGVNDIAALQAADVGVSVSTACDAARCAADLLLTQKSLAVLEAAVVSGREVFLNMVKYIKMAASSNFGNMFSVLGASLFVPFIPMMPLQVVTSNFLYDVAQLGIPTDRVDARALAEPLRLNMRYLQIFIVLVGFISSVFDYITFAVLYYPLHADSANQELFHTGWFVEGLLSQTIIVFVLRLQQPRQDRSGEAPPTGASPSTAPSQTLVLLSLLVCLTGVSFPQIQFLRDAFGFVALPSVYWAYLAAILSAYMAATWVAMRNAGSDEKLLSSKFVDGTDAALRQRKDSNDDATRVVPIVEATLGRPGSLDTAAAVV